MNRIALPPSPRRTARRLLAAGLLGAAVLVTGLLAPGIVTAAAAPAGVSAKVHETAAALPTAPPTAGPPTAADGLIAAGQVVSVFDDRVPAVANLNAVLLAAVRRAATDAAASGIRFQVNSGWRSPKLQAWMLRQAIADYGSKAAAERWVATPEASEHVKGEAIDLGPSAADDWLERHGAAYGLCRIYANEAWHFELRPRAVTDGCPAMYADPSHDPRLQQ